jgi:hypothetical protein
VDAFYLAFQGSLRDEARVELGLLQAKCAALKTEVGVQMSHNGGELRGALSSRSRDGWWSIRSAWLTVTVDERASHDWIVEVKPSALLLMREGPRAALSMARAAARALLETVTGERTRRLDLCADLTGFDLGGLNVRGFVTHHRTGIADISAVKEYWRAGKRTGFVIGKGDAMARVYDKTEHLRLGLDDTKADDEYAEWRFGGWNGHDDVTRVEFQLRGRLLDELDLRDPERALSRLDATWSYCTKKWLRLVDLDSSTRKERCATDACWQALEDVVFRAKSEPAKRTRAPSVPHARRMVSAVVNYSACAGMLAYCAGDARERVAGWSNPRAEAWIQEQLFDMSRRTVLAATVDLVGRFDDARAAAAHLMEKQSAAAVKFTSVRTYLHAADVAA